MATANGNPGSDHRQGEQKLVFLGEPVADLDRPVPLFVLDRWRQQHEPGVEAGLTCLFKRPGQFKAELFIARKQRQPEGALPQYPIVLAGLERGLELAHRLAQLVLADGGAAPHIGAPCAEILLDRSEETTSELPSPMRITSAV